MRKCLVSSTKEEVRRKTPPMARSFLASQPTYLSETCFDVPRRVLGPWIWPKGFGFLYQRFSLLVRNEAGQFRNQQAERWSNGDHGSYLRLVAYSFFWLSERA